MNIKLTKEVKEKLIEINKVVSVSDILKSRLILMGSILPESMIELDRYIKEIQEKEKNETPFETIWGQIIQDNILESKQDPRISNEEIQKITEKENISFAFEKRERDGLSYLEIPFLSAFDGEGIQEGDIIIRNEQKKPNYFLFENFEDRMEEGTHSRKIKSLFIEEDGVFPCVLKEEKKDIRYLTRTDTQMLDRYLETVNKVKGDIILLYIGNGILPYLLAKKEGITSLTIVDPNKNSIKIFKDIVLPHIENKDKEKINIVNEDAFSYIIKNDMEKRKMDGVVMDWGYHADLEEYFVEYFKILTVLKRKKLLQSPHRKALWGRMEGYLTCYLNEKAIKANASLADKLLFYNLVKEFGEKIEDLIPAPIRAVLDRMYHGKEISDPKELEKIFYLSDIWSNMENLFAK